MRGARRRRTERRVVLGRTPCSLRDRHTQAVFPLFVLAMLLVPAAASAGTFAVCWKFMARRRGGGTP